MGEFSLIEWCHSTFNAFRGCVQVSPACDHCYAMVLARRNPGTLGRWGTETEGGTRVVASEAMWALPEKWNEHAAGRVDRHRVFTNSLADVFEEWSGPMVSSKGLPLWWCHGSLSNSPIPSKGLTAGCRMATMDDIRARLFQMIVDTPNLDWLLLTKRPENIEVMACDALGILFADTALPSNIWVGVTVENRASMPRIDVLREIRASVRFLSIEPLLEDLGEIDLTDIHWVIVGGESGHDARPMNPWWVERLRDHCIAQGVAFFFKQWGEFAPAPCIDPHVRSSPRVSVPSGVPMDEPTSMFRVGKRAAGRLLDGREWNEMPSVAESIR